METLFTAGSPCSAEAAGVLVFGLVAATIDGNTLAVPQVISFVHDLCGDSRDSGETEEHRVVIAIGEAAGIEKGATDGIDIGIGIGDFLLLIPPPSSSSRLQPNSTSPPLTKQVSKCSPFSKCSPLIPFD